MAALHDHLSRFFREWYSRSARSVSKCVTHCHRMDIPCQARRMRDPEITMSKKLLPVYDNFLDARNTL
jgi:hypothetical protein